MLLSDVQAQILYPEGIHKGHWLGPRPLQPICRNLFEQDNEPQINA